jgi:hypothetical protein
MEGSDVIPANDNVEVPQAANDNVEAAGVEAVQAEPPPDKSEALPHDASTRTESTSGKVAGVVAFAVASLFTGSPDSASGLGHEIAGIVDARGSADLSSSAAAELSRETVPAAVTWFDADARWGEQHNASVSNVPAEAAGVKAAEHEPVIDPATGQDVPTGDPWQVLGYEAEKLVGVMEDLLKLKEDGLFDEQGETLRVAAELEEKHAAERSELASRLDADKDLDPAVRAREEAGLAARQVAEYTGRLEALAAHFRALRGSAPDKG